MYANQVKALQEMFDEPRTSSMMPPKSNLLKHTKLEQRLNEDPTTNVRFLLSF